MTKKSIKQYYKIDPLLIKRIWGGEKLKKLFHSNSETTIGEAWLCSGIKDSESWINEMSLSEFYKNNKKWFGDSYHEKFPLLIKLIDAKSDLSIQVHPDDDQAWELEKQLFGKSECWVILNCSKNSKIVVGHNAKDNKQLNELIDKKQWKNLISNIDINIGDIFQINPGTVHAIKANTLLYELQQSSDVTYRLYDYDRLENGKLRELHIKKAKKVITSPQIVQKNKKLTIKESKSGKINLLVDSPNNYKLYECLINSNFIISNLSKNFKVLTVIQGEIKFDKKNYSRGESIIFSANLEKIEIFSKKARIFIATI